MNLKISQLNLINTLITSLIFTTVIGYFLIIDVQKEFENNRVLLKEMEVESQSQRIKKEIDRVVDKVALNRFYAFKNRRKDLQEKANNLSSILSKAYIEKNNLSRDEIINIFNIEYTDTDYYFYIFDKNGKIVHYTKEIELEGKNIFTDLTQDIADLARKATVINNVYSKKVIPIDRDIKRNKKDVYITKIDSLDYYLGVGIYINQLEMSIQNKVINFLMEDRYGIYSDGYFWIHDKDGTVIMHPDRPSLVGKSLVTIRDRNGVYLFKEFNKAINNDYKAGYANYLWYNKDGIIDQKTSYVRLLNGWDLVVGTGFYHSSIDKLIIKKQALLEKFLKQDLIKMSIILLVLFLSTTAIAIYISNKTKKLEEEEEEHLAMLENYKIALDESSIVTITDINGKIEYVNEQFCRVSGYCDNDIIGLSHKIVRHENTPKETFKELWETISSGNIWKGVIKNKTKTGESYYNSATIVPLKDIKGDITGFISISYNVTELIENKEKLENIFLTDRLTSLGSRFKLLQELDNSNEQTNLLALIDIDSFRGINNLYGQEFGDEVIKIVANLIFKALEKYDYKLFRIHADVFAVLSRGDRFTIFLEKIKHAVDDINSNTVNIKSQKISISFTTSFARGDSNVLAYADSALKSAKKNKKLFEVYSDDIQITKEYEDNIYWVNTLKQAFKDDLIFPFYQPIYNYHTGKIEKYECLVRMINDGKIVSPNSFLDVAKKTKLYSKITITVIEKVINKFKNLDYEFSINLSVEDLLNSETMDFLYSMAKKENIFKRMVIEIVESEELQSFDEIHNILQRFKKAGSKIAIDDFGSGYSTFDYLIYLNADYVKIDGSIVKLIEKDERAKDIVKSIIEFAKKSNMKTIAEYVSSVEIDTIVSELGVDYAQGFYRGKPAEDIIY